MRPLVPLDRWARVEEVFTAATLLPPGDREAFAQRECAGDQDLLREVVSLLRYDSREVRTLLDALEAEAASLVAGESLEGRMLGPWRIERELGRGGMAVVYLGMRADGEFRKRVAIKLIRRGMDTGVVIERLRRERRILAALDHPYIAKLLDGGTTHDGLPYIVMEHVEGVPVDRFCDEHHLGVDERCRLMTKICQAVAYAHRNLVIHRDLKPSNILVDADGNPKLLDFGIAQLLSGAGEDLGEENGAPLTRGFSRPFTPQYASPEQIGGGAVGTTADVYSLGIVLYELLAGFRPEKDLKASAAAALYGRDRKWQRSLEGDLDNVLQVALSAEPERRYLSVERFEQDLTRHLTGMPVEARAESVVYRCGKFLRRHRLGTMAAGVVALTLTMGLASTLWQAHRAQIEKNLAEARQQEAERQREIAREEARKSAAARMQAEAEHAEADRQRGQAELQKIAAETARGLAERRFGQVRELARKFLFDFDDAIASLPGATPARKMVVATGVRYYDSLVAEAAGNRDLLEEIARGYGRLGDVQGNVYFANLGDAAGAEASYRKALAIQARIADPSPEFLHDRIMSYIRMAQIMISKGDSPGAARYAKEALALGAGSAALELYTVRDAQSLALSALGDAVMESGDTSAAIEPYSKLLALRLELAPAAPDEVAAQRGISNAQAHLGDVYFRSERPAEALLHLRAALAIDERLSAAAPADFRLTRKLRITYSILAEVLKSEPGQALAQPGETTKYLEGAMQLADRMLAVDPDNSQAMRDFVVSAIDLADWLREQKDSAGFSAALGKAVAAARRFSARDLPSAENGVLQQLYRRLANAATDAGHFDEALEDVRKADAYAIAATKENPEATISVMRRNEVAETRALVYSAQQRWDLAIGEYNAIIAADRTMTRRDPDNQMPVNDVAEKYALLAESYAAAGQRDAAVQAMQTAVDTYAAIASRRPLGADEEKRRKEGLAKLADWLKN